MNNTSNPLQNMSRNEIGMFATAKCGHDRNHLYVIIKETNDCVYLADGRLKLLANPKKKNRKHIQIIHQTVEDELRARLSDGEEVRDEEIKRAIRLFQKKQQEEF